MQESSREYEPDRIVNIPSLAFSLIVTIIVIVAMTIIGEESSGFKDFLTDMTGHHWVSKGLIALGVFVVAWLVSAFPLAGQREDDMIVRRWVMGSAGVALVSIVVIILYYIGHFVSE